MTYFSRVPLNRTRRGTRNLVTSPQAMHAAVRGSFAPSVDPGRVLWRLDQKSSHDLELYVVSGVRPDFTGLVEQAGWPEQSGWDSTDYGVFLGRLVRGQVWRYRLTANPVRSKSTGDPTTRGRIAPHVTVSHQIDWLRCRSERWGFKVPMFDDGTETGAADVTVSGRQTASFRRGADDKSGKVRITRATFEGVLEVTDPDALRTALTEGCGRAKAYGCGLLTLARLT